MHDAIAVIICLLAVLGLYALFSRIAVMLLPHGNFFITVDGRAHTEEEILLLAEYARLFAERDRKFFPCVSVLLDENETEKAMTLRKEGILVYIEKKEP